MVTVESNLLVDRHDVPSKVLLGFKRKLASQARKFAFLVRFQMLVKKFLAFEAGTTLGTAEELTNRVDRLDVILQLGVGEERR